MERRYPPVTILRFTRIWLAWVRGLVRLAKIVTMGCRKRREDCLAEVPSTGTPIGICDGAGQSQRVCIPEDVRLQHVHLFGAAGQGKTNCMVHMALHDVNERHGVAVIDPRGEMVADLLRRLPSRQLDRIIYLNPAEPDWVPIWNPLKCGTGQGAALVADATVRAFRGLAGDMGDRLEYLLRQAIIGVLHLPDGTLFDVCNLLRKGTPESERLRHRILAVVDDAITRRFWEHDFLKYTPIDLVPPQHRLSKLLGNVTISRMLSQPESRFNFRDIMDTGKILLVDLSGVGIDAGNVLGCLVISHLYWAARSRSGSDPAMHKAFHIYCDEAHHSLTPALEELMSEARRFSVSLTLAHQRLSQLVSSQRDAVCGIGSTLIFRVDRSDAVQLERNLQGLVEVKDLITLRCGQAIARIGTQVLHIRTYVPATFPQINEAGKIIRQSHRRYYRPTTNHMGIG